MRTSLPAGVVRESELIYCPMIALHVSSDIIAHHQKLLNCVLQLLVIHAYVTACRCCGRIRTESVLILSVRQAVTYVLPEAVKIQFRSY